SAEPAPRASRPPGAVPALSPAFPPRSAPAPPPVSPVLPASSPWSSPFTGPRLIIPRPPRPRLRPFALTPAPTPAYDEAAFRRTARTRTRMAALDEFADVVKRNEPLAPYTYLKLGGPAEMLVQPRSRDELAAVVRRCFQEHIPLRVLGG